MVKFAKQLEGSLVPESKDAYWNYKELKREVNRIKEDRQLQIHGAGIVVARRGSMSQLHSLGTHLKRTAHGLNPLNRTSDQDQVPPFRFSGHVACMFQSGKIVTFQCTELEYQIWGPR